MATIKDIAREAGVSHGTVSNVLNKTGKVSMEKIKLVEAAAKKLGYTPNTQAQLLRQGSKKQIAIILPSIKDENYACLFESIERNLISYDYEILLYTTNDIIGLEEKILDLLPLSQLTAIITVSCLAHTIDYYKADCPVFYVNRNFNRADKNTFFFTFDFEQAGMEIGDYIINKNWKKIVFYSGSSKFDEERLLYEGLSISLTNSNVSIQPISSDNNLMINKAFDILKNCRDIDAVVTSNPLRAEALESAMNYYRPLHPLPIITIGPYQAFFNNHFISYQLNYSRLGSVIADTLTNYLIHKKHPAPILRMEGNGFRYRFRSLVKKKNRTLSLLTLQTPSTTALLHLLPSFMELSGIEVKPNVLSYDDLYSSIEMLKHNNFYDLIRIDVAWFSEMAQQLYRPLSDTGIRVHDIGKHCIPGLFPSYSHVGECQYALPFDPSVQIFLYRKDLFSDAVLKRAYYEMYHNHLTIPKTFEQYRQAAAFFTQSINPESPTAYGTTLTYGSTATAACDFLPWLIERIPNLYETSHICLNTPNALEALESYLETFKYTMQAENSWWQHSVKEFADGNTAMNITFSNHASYILNSKHSSVVGKTGASIVPGGHPLLGGGVIGISKNSTKLEECREFFQWYYSSETSSAMIMLGGSSPHKDIFTNYDDNILFPWLSGSKTSFEIGTRILKGSNISQFPLKKFEHIIGTAVRSAINRTMTPKEALDYAQYTYEAFMEADK